MKLLVLMKVKVKVKSLSRVQLFETLWTVAYQASPSMGFFQARILEWIIISFSRGSSQPRDQTWVSLIGSRCFNLRATRDWLIQIYEINLWQCSRLIYLLQMAILIVNTPLPHFQQLIPLRLLSSNLAVSGKPLRLAAFKIYSIQWISKNLLCHWENTSILVLKSMKRQIPIQSSLSYSSTLAPGSCHLSVVRFQSLCPWSQWWMWQCGHAFLWSVGHSDHIVKRRRQWHPIPVLFPGKSHGWRSLVGCSPWGPWGSDTTERLHFDFSLSCIGEGNGNPLQCSCLENPRGGGAWWAAVFGFAQSQTRLKWLSSSQVSMVKRHLLHCIYSCGKQTPLFA